MKKYSKLITIFLSICMLFLLTSHTQAATTNLSAADSVTEGDTITVTVTVNAAQWNLTLTANGKALNTWTETVNYKENLSKTFTASYKTTAKGTVNFVLTGDITDVNQTNTEINTSKSVTVNAKPVTNPSGNTGSSGNSSGSSGNTTTTKPPENKPTVPTFKSANKTVYTTGKVNLRASWSTSSAATLVKKGTELKLTGTSTQTVNGYVWYRVTYNGATKYIASSLITETKPKAEEPKENKSSNKNLSSLKIEGVELEPEFNKETTQYTAKVDGDVTELKVDAKAEDSKAKVAIEGNKDLKEGDNVIKIKVTAEDATTRTYFATVTKGEGTVTDDTLKLSELKIERVDFENSFKPDTYSYELSLNTYVKNLEITAIPNQADAKVEITGNEEFKAGKNKVIILVTSADGTKTANYQIEVNLPEEVITESNNSDDNMIMYIIAGVVIAVAIIIIIIIIIRHHRNSEYEDEDELSDENEVEEVETAEEKITKREKAEATVDDFLNYPNDDEKPRKRKGRHSM